MGAMLTATWDALLLDRPVFLDRRRGRDLGLGLALLFAVSLLAGLADGAAWARQRMDARALREGREQIVADLEGPLARSPLPPDTQQELTRNLAAWFDLQGELEALPRPLGHSAGLALTALERATAAPYRRLALWLPYSLIVFALARALGGRASLREMLAATALYAAPHALDVLRPLPWIGAGAGLIASGWGAAIYIRATAVANRLDMPRALVAVLAPAAVVVTVLLVGLAVVAVLW